MSKHKLLSAYYIIDKLENAYPSVPFRWEIVNDILEIKFTLIDNSTALFVDCTILISELLTIRQKIEVDDQEINISNDTYDCIYDDADAIMKRINEGNKILESCLLFY